MLLFSKIQIAKIHKKNNITIFLFTSHSSKIIPFPLCLPSSLFQPLPQSLSTYWVNRCLRGGDYVVRNERIWNERDEKTIMNRN